MSVEANATRTGAEVAEAMVLDTAQVRRWLRYAKNRFGILAEDGEDLIQEAALEVLRTESLIHSPRGFAFRIFHSRCCQFIGARRSFFQPFPLEEVTPRREVASPAGELDRALVLRQGLSRISPSCRSLLATYYVEGRSLKETADALSRASSSIAKMLSRCLQRLKKCVAR